MHVYMNLSINIFKNHHEMDQLMVVDRNDWHQMLRKVVVKVKMIIPYNREI
jgi:hypothetical protein